MNSLTTTGEEIGGFITILFIFPLADSKGRKFTATYLRIAITFAVSICQLLAALFQASEFFILGQMILGAHFSLRTFLTPMYILECAPDYCRGFTSAVLVFAYVIAKLVMFSLASPSLFGTSQYWFIFPIVMMISSVAVSCLLIRLPESPKWLILNDRVHEARSAIKFYHGKYCELDDTVASMTKEKNLSQGNKLTLKQVWENETLKQSLKILFALLIFTVFDTTVIMSMYTILLHKEAGFTVQAAMNINLIITTILIPTKFFGTFLLDILGRRPTMMIAGLMQYSKSVILLVTQSIIYIVGSTWVTQILYVIAEALNAVVPATGMYTIRVLLVSELFPPSARTVVGQALMIGNMILVGPVTSLFPIVDSIFPPIFFVPFVIVQLIFGIYLYRHLPETKGRPVYEIIESMERSASIMEENTPLIRDRARTYTTKKAKINVKYTSNT